MGRCKNTCKILLEDKCCFECEIPCFFSGEDCGEGYTEDNYRNCPNYIESEEANV